MNIIPVQQGSKEWLDWRKGKITASDAGIILGMNKYTNVCTLWDEKGEDAYPKIPNKHMQRGITLEPVARELFIQTTGIMVEPLVVEHDELIWMGASLDGIDECGDIIVEIKCPLIGGHVSGMIYGEILPMYKAQMQHQLYCTGAEICFYVTYNEQHEQKLNIIEVSRDEKFMENMIEAELYFYKEFMCGFKKPPPRWKYQKKE